MSEKLKIDRKHGQHLFREMLRIRRFEAKCVELYQAQKIRGFLHLYDGQEAVAVGIMQALDDRDTVIATYRDHGHALVRGVGMGPIMAEMYGKLEGCSRGRGGSMHIFDRATRFLGGVRRQNIWRNSRRRLAECRPRLGIDVRRRACGVASADVRWSVA